MIVQLRHLHLEELGTCEVQNLSLDGLAEQDSHRRQIDVERLGEQLFLPTLHTKPFKRPNTSLLVAFRPCKSGRRSPPLPTPLHSLLQTGVWMFLLWNGFLSLAKGPRATMRRESRRLRRCYAGKYG